MTTHFTPRLYRGLQAVALACLFTSLPVHAQDAGKALGGLFNNLLNQGSQGNQAKPSGGLGGMLNIGGGNNATQGVNVGDLANLLNQSLEDIDEPKEIEMGRNLASVLLGAKPLHSNMALQRYVNRLGRWISLQSPRPDLPWSFAVLDDTGYNAFAAPGGFVFVTKGLIDSVADEAELAGILAHEITHVVAKHHLKALRKNARAGLVSQVLASQINRNVPAGLSSALVGLGRDLYAKGLDQEDELDADRSGVALAARAGFDPYGLVAVLQQLRTAAADDPMFALSLSTHPPAQVRLDQLELAMGQRLDSFSGKAAVTVKQRLARAGNR
ncbi:M48 family metalloprotease, partial [Rhodoferax saidenbachensis]|uniref:Peptidase M48 n=1 Tax=Rhodoferax saidenbachensis TaxID=1484693 RepID=A0A1P8KC20_9BURK